MLHRHRQKSLIAFILFLQWSSASAQDPWTDTARYAFEYHVAFDALEADRDSHLRIWVPFPAETSDQQLISTTIESPWPYTLERDRLGNRSLYMEGVGTPPQDLRMRFVVERSPSQGISEREIAKNQSLAPENFAKADKLIPLAGAIRALAVKHGAGHETTRSKVRAYYDYVVRNMRYDKAGSGWGRGDAVWACDNQRGNCTDFHSLLIGMARSQGIPARFVIGFPLASDADSAQVAGYHCWSQFYEDDAGWSPLDASEAKKTGRPDDYFGQLPNDRIEFTAGRDLILTPPQKGEPLNFFIYPYSERDGEKVEQDQLRTRFHFETLRPAQRLAATLAAIKVTQP